MFTTYKWDIYMGSSWDDISWDNTWDDHGSIYWLVVSNMTFIFPNSWDDDPI